MRSKQRLEGTGEYQLGFSARIITGCAEQEMPSNLRKEKEKVTSCFFLLKSAENVHISLYRS